MRALAVAGGLLLLGLGGTVSVAQRGEAEHWTTAWAAADAWQPQTLTPVQPGSVSTDRPPFARFFNQTLRQVVRTTLGGRQHRVVFSNRFGTTPMVIGAAGIALRGRDATITWGSHRSLTFSGQTGVTIPPQSVAISDPVGVSAAPLDDLAIDLFLPGDTGATMVTMHPSALQTAYASSAGNHVGEIVFPVRSRSTSWFFLNRIDVLGAAEAAAIVVAGDSLADGIGSTQNTHGRWPDELARRLEREPSIRPRSVVNLALAGNRVLSPGPPHYGQSLLDRFERDVLTVPGAAFVIVSAGLNDIGMVREGGPAGVDEIVAAYRQMADAARARGLKAYAGTLTPFAGAGYYRSEREATRQAVNSWLRTSRVYDGVIDFDAVVRDPESLTRLLPTYDSGDHLHPNDAGYKAMGTSVDLTLFR